MRQAFLQALRDVLGPTPGIAVIHSSLARLVPPPGFGRWDALYGLRALIDSGWTVALPSFTFSFCGGRPYHHADSPSETGVLADWLLTGDRSARRTAHPIYSFVVAGPEAERIAACPTTTTFGADSPFGLFAREDATTVMAGCGWEYCTQFHQPEETAAVPYRYFKDFAGTADYGDGAHDVKARMFVRDLALNPRNDFTPVVDRLRRDGAMATASLWRGTVEAASTAAIERICDTMLAADKFAFVENGAELAHRHAKLKQAAKQPPLRLAVLGSANVHHLTAALADQLSTLLPDRTAEIHEVPYGQLRQALLDPRSELRRFDPQISVFCDRLEDLAGQPSLDGLAPDLLLDLAAGYAEMIAGHHADNGGWVVVHRFAVLGRMAGGIGDKDAAALIARANAILDERLGGLDRLVWLDLAAEAGAAAVPVLDARLWYLGRFPFSEAFNQRLAGRWAGIALAVLGKSARLVVLDLDNTMWGGVLGEEGIAGVRIGGDYPGNAFLAFQKAVKALTERGIALAVCSKNDEDLALQALETLPAMQIRSGDIVAHRINWRPKSANIQEIAEELSLGLESVLFVDDNPVEREAVRRNLPGVKVLDLPADPALYADALMRSPWLEVAAVTAEDRKRVGSYRARRQIEQQRTTAASLDDFYASLQMKLHLQPLDDSRIARAAQLCQKTNQFNTTTRRYDQRELRQIVDQGGDVVVLGLEDRYSELENIGLLILKQDDGAPGAGVVDNYLLSCRVLGRGLETAILDWAVGRAAHRGWSVLRGPIIETERNTPVRNVFQDAGFARADDRPDWARPVTGTPVMPPWLTIVDTTTPQ
ncbi:MULTISPECIES: HAD-IIIC family phosphatase [Inquilinus]|uniref:aminoglycoside N(3)-acetyltransferase n=1 Tax=Inquilinus ginsengisoli TaxID=363840 RepID=A0ABU1JYC2_9PROT|nr:HAD-IIIC family phosphatase [Inquilinus ginsengisoli]MDR6292549.1 FkbH-like protein [Inquilinus ginsengisoli]